MPLLKKTPFALLDPPEDLERKQHVYQVRFTKEIFVDYKKYVSRINLYRQRIWTCKITGKTNLTFEEALVCERAASQKVHNIPKDLITLALPMIQFSMLPLKYLSEKIAIEYHNRKILGTEVLGKKNDSACLCRIVDIREEGEIHCYKVEWLDENKDVTETSEVLRDDLILKKNPVGKKILKSFIRDSTYQSSPWIIHQCLAKEHKISSKPLEFRQNTAIVNGAPSSKKEKRGSEDQIDTKEEGNTKKKVKKENVIKYPIEDSMVESNGGESTLPVPSKNFTTPMECVGDVLMIWNFCSSFGKLIHLFPFSLGDFEQSLISNESVSNLIIETHIALLRFLINDEGQYSESVLKNNSLSKLSNSNWADYLCEFIEMLDRPQFGDSLSMIKRDHYGLLNVQAKLEILTELVNEALETNLFREVLEENVQHRHVIEATKKEISLQEARIKKNEVKAKPGSDESLQENTANGILNDSNGEKVEKQESGEFNLQEKDALDQSETELNVERIKLEEKQLDDNDSKSELSKGNTKKEVLKQLKEEKMEVAQKRSKEQRMQYFEREMEKRVLRANCLGKDKNRNRYWLFQRDARIFVESFDFKIWGFYNTIQEFDSLVGSLNPKGIREKALQAHLLKHGDKIRLGLKKKSEASAHKMGREDVVLRRSTRVRATQVHGYVNKWK